MGYFLSPTLSATKKRALCLVLVLDLRREMREDRLERCIVLFRVSPKP